jgi:hypothetical protein
MPPDSSGVGGHSNPHLSATTQTTKEVDAIQLNNVSETI